MNLIRMLVLAASISVGCGDNRAGPAIDAGLAVDTGPDASLAGDLFGEPCTQPPFPQIGTCHDGQGGCTDETGGSVCRPFCHIDGVEQCMPRGGTQQITDRGACVCEPQ
jgi:hypothetical protein